jgi:hypothetical protein
MNPGDLVKTAVRIVGKDIRQDHDIGIIIAIVRMEKFGPPDYIVMWSSEEVTLSRGFHLQVIKDVPGML